MDREVTFTGIGGQGVQLAAQVLARAATLEGRFAQFFGIYQGFMRGGSTEATVVVADGRVQVPPIVSTCWAGVALHQEFFASLAAKLRPGSLLLLDPETFDAPVVETQWRVITLPMAELARQVGHASGLSMVALGALAAVTDLVAVDSLVAGMQEALPTYRRQHAPRNEAALRAGYDAAPRGAAPAWRPAVTA